MKIRERFYVTLLNLAARVAPPDVRAIHNEVLGRGLSATHEALDARIAAHSENPR